MLEMSLKIIKNAFFPRDAYNLLLWLMKLTTTLVVSM